MNSTESLLAYQFLPTILGIRVGLLSLFGKEVGVRFGSGSVFWPIMVSSRRYYHLFALYAICQENIFIAFSHLVLDEMDGANLSRQFIFQIGGACVFGLGVWTIVDRSFVNELLGTNLFSGAVYVLTITSALVCILSFLGCMGAVKEVKCLLLTVRIQMISNFSTHQF